MALPTFPTAPPYYRYVLLGRWLFLRGVVAAGRVKERTAKGSGEMNETASPLTGDPIPERLVAERGDGYAMADALNRYVFVLRALDGKRAVDLGCGTGYGAHVLASVATETVGVDVSEEALEFARSHYQGVDYRRLDLTVDPLPEGDVASCFEVLEHLSDPDRLMRAALSSYERVFFSFPNPWWHMSQLNPHHVNDWPLREVKARLRAAGAREIRLSSQMLRRPEVVRGWRPRASSWIFDCTS